MFYLQREHASGTGYEYATTRPTIANGDVSTTWGAQAQARPFGERAAYKWAELLGCGVTRFSGEVPGPPPPPADRVAARKARVAAYLAAVAAGTAEPL